MKYRSLTEGLDLAAQGKQMYELASELFPVCRSITGEGLRATLRTIQKSIPISVHEIPTGTAVLDWTVPQEWNIREAYIADLSGRRVVDFKSNNLHVLNYSIPVKKRISLTELKAHLHSLPDKPDLIPYRTSYYNPTWGICLSHNQLESMTDPEYDVCIDSTLTDGHLTYGEYLLAGESTGEILISCHSCHPSLANDNLSGIVLSTALAKVLGGEMRRL